MTGRGRNTYNSTPDASKYKTQDIPRVQPGIFSEFACNSSFIGTFTEKQIINLIRQSIHLLKCPICNMSFCQVVLKKIQTTVFSYNWHLRAMTSAQEHSENWESCFFFFFLSQAAKGWFIPPNIRNFSIFHRFQQWESFYNFTPLSVSLRSEHTCLHKTISRAQTLFSFKFISQHDVVWCV